MWPVTAVILKVGLSDWQGDAVNGGECTAISISPRATLQSPRLANSTIQIIIGLELRYSMAKSNGTF